MTDSREQPLAPTAFAPVAAQHNTESAAPPPRLRGWIPAGVGLLVLLWVVVFFLPDWVQTRATLADAKAGAPPVQSDRDAGSGIPGAASSTPTAGAGSAGQDANAPSPFADAQVARQRRAAQDVLQPLLELQAFLEERGVTEWAPDAYSAALAKAESGDAAYQDRQFAEATSAYNDAMRALESLEQQLPVEIERSKAALNAALEALALDAATAQLQTLERIAPDDTALGQLAARIDALPRVIDRLEAAGAAADQGDFAAAVTAAEAAVESDPVHEAARRSLDDYQQLRLQQRFTRAMSAGYSALAEEAFERADARFREAAALRPGATEPSVALEELAAAQTAAKLRALRDTAAQFEAEEQWAEALTRYREALAIDNTLVFAREGAARTEPRAEVTAAAQAVIDAPERLVEAPVLNEAQAVLAQLQAQRDSGPRYQALLATLTETLEKATTPVSITLSSDGMTDVTIARVARLGTFTEQSITLRPGPYTAVGIRNGYRDVRVAFSVSTEGEKPVVDVRCSEAL